MTLGFLVQCGAGKGSASVPLLSGPKRYDPERSGEALPPDPVSVGELQRGGNVIQLEDRLVVEQVATGLVETFVANLRAQDLPALRRLFATTARGGLSDQWLRVALEYTGVTLSTANITAARMDDLERKRERPSWRIKFDLVSPSRALSLKVVWLCEQHGDTLRIVDQEQPVDR
ncbi:MAG: hypothetical protein KBF88_09150 [Polyangiaceae bacterium]|nr:hypothetical protein [Polyangiaceae bacterium]